MEGYLISSTVIIGIINQVRTQFPQLTGLWSFLAAVVLGVGFGFLHWFGLTGIEQGFTSALVSSGIYTVAKQMGKGNIPSQPNL